MTVTTFVPSQRIELPYPPSVNHYYRRVGARTLISREGRAYRKAVHAAALAARASAMSGLIEVEVWLNPPDRRRRDLDNTLKSLLDALQHAGLYADDSQIVRIEAERCRPVPGGLVTVTLRQREAG